MPGYVDFKERHNAQVEKAASESAIRLKNRYGHQIDTEDKLSAVLTDMSDWVLTLPDDGKGKASHVRAAQRCVGGLLSGTSYYDFKELSSSILLKELMALSYLAINDHEIRKASYPTFTDEQLASLDTVAKQRFIAALYEIRRGRNLNRRGIDDKDDIDLGICAGGAFNDIIEKLSSGIHIDCSMVYVSQQEEANRRLPEIVIDELKKFLLDKMKSSNRLNDVRDLIEQIRQAGTLESIWDQLKPAVTAQFEKELKGFSNDEMWVKDFKDDFINAGVYVASDELNKALLEVEQSNKEIHQSMKLRKG